MNIEKIREALGWARHDATCAFAYKEEHGYKEHAKKARKRVAIIDELLAELDKAQQDAEPVAWMNTYTGLTMNNGSKQMHDRDGVKHGYTIPLYTHPPQVQQSGKVLTDEEIERIAEKAVPPFSGMNVEHGLRIEHQHEGALIALRYARDNGYLAPAAGLTVEEVMEVFRRFSGEHVSVLHMDFLLDSDDELAARLTAAINAKVAK